LRLIYSRHCKGRNSALEGFLDALGISWRQSILVRQRAMRPGCGVITGTQIFEFDNKAIAQYCRGLRFKHLLSGTRLGRVDPVAICALRAVLSSSVQSAVAGSIGFVML
jgi:hypothetical protein